MKYEFKLNDEQRRDIKRCVNAVEAYRAKLDKVFLSGEISFQVASNCNLFFTLDALKEILNGAVWEMSINNLDGECKLLDMMIDAQPEQFSKLQSELKEIHNAFEALQMLKIA